ncbi:hypothetical protein D3C76_1253460 [compost metagenome]
MAVAVPAGIHDSRVAPFGHRQEAVRRTGSIDCINGHFHGPVGAVFEPDRARQAGCQLAVNLRFRGTRTNRAPAHQISQVLRGDHIQKLARCR